MRKFLSYIVLLFYILSFFSCQNRKQPASPNFNEDYYFEEDEEKDIIDTPEFIEIGMTLDEIKHISHDNVIPCHVPGYDNGLFYSPPIDYYLINNFTAVTLKNNQVDMIYTWDTNYYTENNLHVGSTLGDVLGQYSTNMECWYVIDDYNYRTQSYETMLYLSSENSCTYFAFLVSQLTTQQKSAICETITTPSCGPGRVYLSKLSYSMLQSISSSLHVSYIGKSNCLDKQPKSDPFTSNSIGSGIHQESFYIKFQDNETFELSDGTNINASLTTFGLGDLTLKISWSGKSPTKLSWIFDGSGMSPTSNVIYAKKNGDTYSLSEWVHFDWTSNDPEIRGVNFTIYPITEEERKYER